MSWLKRLEEEELEVWELEEVREWEVKEKLGELEREMKEERVMREYEERWVRWILEEERKLVERWKELKGEVVFEMELRKGRKELVRVLGEEVMVKLVVEENRLRDEEVLGRMRMGLLGVLELGVSKKECERREEDKELDEWWNEVCLEKWEEEVDWE